MFVFGYYLNKRLIAGCLILLSIAGFGIFFFVNQHSTAKSNSNPNKTVIDIGPQTRPPAMQFTKPQTKTQTQTKPKIHFVKKPTQVIMVVFDELPVLSLLTPEDTIDARRFPNLARLARQATWYKNHTTVDDQTMYAVPALLSGNLAGEEEFPDAVDHPNNLFTLMHANRRSVDAYELATQLCPVRVCPIPPERDIKHNQAKDPFDYLVKKMRFSKDAARHGLDQWVNSFDTEADFVFLHTPFPHEPAEYLADGTHYKNPYAPKVRIPDIDRVGTGWWSSPLVVQKHLMQVAYTDKILGDLMNHLQTNNKWDDAMIIITSDHGTNFQPGENRRLLGRNNLAAIGMPLLLIKYPGQNEAEVKATPTQSIDIVPTVVRTTNLKSAYPMDGIPINQVTLNRLITINGKQIGFGELAWQKAEDHKRLINWVGSRPLNALGPVSFLIDQPAVPVSARKPLTSFDQAGNNVLITGNVGLPQGSLVAAADQTGKIVATSYVFRWQAKTKFAFLFDRKIKNPYQLDVFEIQNGQVYRQIN